jgi:iron complex outermembrane receptor protein/outer membrane receptor for ferrienterochelin and colicins
MYIRAVLNNWELYAGYTFTIAERKYMAQNQFVPLTPRHRAAFTLVKDFEEKGWRVGLEGSYNGPQYRFDASQTPDYLFMAAMVEKRFGKKWSVVLNGENLLDYRQSKEEPLYNGSVTNPDFVPLWGPIDGRVINLSVKLNLFNK